VGITSLTEYSIQAVLKINSSRITTKSKQSRSASFQSTHTCKINMPVMEYLDCSLVILTGY
jgi:hypothetical protein